MHIACHNESKQWLDTKYIQTNSVTQMKDYNTQVLTENQLDEG